MSAMKVTALTTAQLHLLDRFCQPIRAAFGRPPYLVGSAGLGSDGTYRDVDVRLILPDEEFAAVCPTRERWELLSLTISVYLSTATGLPVDFQVQRQGEANEKHDKPRNPLGTGRVFAGGGDATPDWDASAAGAGAA